MGVKAVVQKLETVNKRQIKGRVKHTRTGACTCKRTEKCFQRQELREGGRPMSEDEMDLKVEKITQRIADYSAPREMTTAEARLFYEGIASWLETALDGLECDDDEESDEEEI